MSGLRLSNLNKETTTTTTTIYLYMRTNILFVCVNRCTVYTLHSYNVLVAILFTTVIAAIDDTVAAVWHAPQCDAVTGCNNSCS